MQLLTQGVRAILLRVVWTPVPENEAHSDIQDIPVADGPEKTYIRGKLSALAKIILPVPD